MSLRTHLRNYSAVCLAVAFITLVGAYPRISNALSSDFPINDGGLFYTMIKDLEAAGYSLPVYSSYNSAHIPFTYPPLGLFLASSLARLLHSPLLDMVRLLPALLSILTVPAFTPLAMSILDDRPRAMFATIAFAMLPTSFDWLTMGGGITRALGFLLTLLLLQQVRRLSQHPGLLRTIAVMCLASLTILSHPGMLLFAIYSAMIVVVASARNWKAIGCLGMAMAGSVLLTAPWWVTVVSRHGMAPFMSASTFMLSLDSLLPFIILAFTNEVVLDILAVMGLIGLIVCVKDRKYVLVIWLLTVVLMQGRAWQICITVPFAMAAGIGIDVMLRALARSEHNVDGEGTTIPQEIQLRLPQGMGPVIALGYLLGISLVSAVMAAPHAHVSSTQADAMQWTANNTAVGSTFVVITGIADFSGDAVAEWFPALSRRVSLSTAQGYEWFPGVFERRRILHASLQNCTNIQCLDDWGQKAGYDFDYVYVVLPPGGSELYTELLASPDFVLLYSKSDVGIFARH